MDEDKKDQESEELSTKNDQPLEEEESDKKDQEEEFEEVENEEEEEEVEDKEDEELKDEENSDDISKDREIKFRGFNPNEEKDEIEYESDNAPRKGGMKKFIIWLVILAILALGIGWLATSKLFKSSPNEEVKITEQQTTPTPTPVVEEKLERSEWSLEVLNGSGVSGLAKKVADGLTGLGYQVVKVGNADKQTYTQSQIFVKDELKGKIDKVVADIKDIVKISSVSGQVEDSTASARIIIGKE